MTPTNPTLANIYEQPGSLRTLAPTLTQQISRLQPIREQIQQGAFQRIIFTGMGGSLAVCHPAALHLMQAGLTALVLESSELLYSYDSILDSRTLLIAVSQSGESVEVIRLLEAHGHKLTTIGITNHPQSTLAQRSTACIELHAGPEHMVANKTYTTSMVALGAVARALSGTALDSYPGVVLRAADTLEAMLPTWDEMAQALAEHLRPARFIVYLGRAESRASVQAGALLTKETAKLPTEGMVAGQFRHGPIEVLVQGEAMAVVIFTGAASTQALNLTLAADLWAKGTTVVCIGAVPEGALGFPVDSPDPAVTPLLEVVPVQLLAARLAQVHGIEPGHFFHGTKVTSTE
jgi:glutamine---fructose-6-phosphate transaminase (isomerizing)